MYLRSDDQGERLFSLNQGKALTSTEKVRLQNLALMECKFIYQWLPFVRVINLNMNGNLASPWNGGCGYLGNGLLTNEHWTVTSYNAKLSDYIPLGHSCFILRYPCLLSIVWLHCFVFLHFVFGLVEVLARLRCFARLICSASFRGNIYPGCPDQSVNNVYMPLFS